MASILLSQRRTLSRVLLYRTESSFVSLNRSLSTLIISPLFSSPSSSSAAAAVSTTTIQSSSFVSRPENYVSRASSTVFSIPIASFATATATKPATRKSTATKTTSSTSTPSSSSSLPAPSTSSSSSPRPEKAWKRKPFTKRSQNEYLMEHTVYEMDKNLAYLIKVGKPTPPSAAALDRLLRVIRTSNEFQIGIRAIYRSYTASIPPSADTATLLAIAAIRTNNIPKVLEMFNELHRWLPLSHGAMARLYKASSSSTGTVATDTKEGSVPSKDGSSKGTKTATETAPLPSSSLTPNEIMNKIHTISRNSSGTSTNETTTTIITTANSTITAMLAALRIQNYRLAVRLVQDFVQYRKHVIRKDMHNQQPVQQPPSSSSSSVSTSASTTTSVDLAVDLVKYTDSSVVRVYTKLILYLVQVSTVTKKDPSSFSKDKLHEILSTLTNQDLRFLVLYNQVIDHTVKKQKQRITTTTAASASSVSGAPKVLESILALVKPEVEKAVKKRTEEETQLLSKQAAKDDNTAATTKKDTPNTVQDTKATVTATPEPTKKA